MIASLPMYMRAENKTAHYNYWQLIRSGLSHNRIDAPAQLQDGMGVDFWTRDDLLLSQTCGMPYRLFLNGKVQLVGTPDYGLKGCPAGYYNSVLITSAKDTRSDISDFATDKLAINSKTSQSGFAAPQNEAKLHGFQFENILISEGHVASAKLVVSGEAQIAAIDAITWQNIELYDDFAGNLKVLSRTQPTPGLPYICALGQDKDRINDAVSAAIQSLSPEDQGKLGIKSLIPLPASEYMAIENP